MRSVSMHGAAQPWLRIATWPFEREGVAQKAIIRLFEALPAVWQMRQ
jgi:hypothetical protein